MFPIIFSVVGLLAARVFALPEVFSPFFAVAILAGHYNKSFSSFATVYGAFVLGDVILGMHSLMWLTHAAFLLLYFCGVSAKNAQVSLALRGTGGILFYFFTTNAYIGLLHYPGTPAQQIGTSLIAGLPFLQAQLVPWLLVVVAFCLRDVHPVSVRQNRLTH